MGSLSIRIKPLEPNGMDSDGLKAKASELWEVIVKLETEKYDLEERQKRQDYDLKELKKSQRSRREAKKVGGSRKEETGDDEGTKGKAKCSRTRKRRCKEGYSGMGNVQDARR